MWQYEIRSISDFHVIARVDSDNNVELLREGGMFNANNQSKPRKYMMRSRAEKALAKLQRRAIEKM
jgi:hypothetical protein